MAGLIVSRRRTCVDVDIGSLEYLNTNFVRTTTTTKHFNIHHLNRYTSTFSDAHDRILKRKNSQQNVRSIFTDSHRKKFTHTHTQQMRPTRRLTATITQVPPYSFGETNIVFRHTSSRFRATSMSFCNVLKLSQSCMEDIWPRFPEAHRLARRWSIKHRLQDLARSGHFVKWLRSISGTFGLQKGVRVKIVKPGSRFAGCLAIITDMNWSGRIKVRMKADGAIKSYLPNHLEVLKLKEDDNTKSFTESKDGELLLTELERTTKNLLKQQKANHELHLSTTKQMLKEQKGKLETKTEELLKQQRDNHERHISITEQLLKEQLEEQKGKLEKKTEELLKQQRDNHERHISITEQLLKEQKEKDGEFLLTELEKTTEQLLKQQRDHHDNHLSEFEKTTEKILKNGQKHQHHTVQEFYKLVKRQSMILESVLKAMADQKTQMKQRMSVLSKDLTEIKSKVNVLLEEEDELDHVG